MRTARGLVCDQVAKGIRIRAIVRPWCQGLVEVVLAAPFAFAKRAEPLQIAENGRLRAGGLLGIESKALEAAGQEVGRVRTFRGECAQLRDANADVRGDACEISLQEIIQFGDGSVAGAPIAKPLEGQVQRRLGSR